MQPTGRHSLTTGLSCSAQAAIKLQYVLSRRDPGEGGCSEGTLCAAFLSCSCMRVPMAIRYRCGLLCIVALEQHCGSLAAMQALGAGGGQSLCVFGRLAPTGPACSRGWAAREPPRSNIRVPMTVMRRCGLPYIMAQSWATSPLAPRAPGNGRVCHPA